MESHAVAGHTPESADAFDPSETDFARGNADQYSREASARDDDHLALRRLSLTAFRNHQASCLEADPRSVVLAGPNGAGKTNLLEAISLLAPGRGLRRARLGDLDYAPDPKQEISQGNRPFENSPWAIAAEVDTANGPVSIGTGRDPGSASEVGRRIVKINGAVKKGQASLAEWVSAVWLTPRMDRLFMEGASERRRFLDRLVYGLDPAHAGRVSSYEQAMRERNRLLKSHGAAAARGWCDGLEAQMAALAVAIAAARLDLVSRLMTLLADEDPAASLGGFPRPTLTLDGAVEDWLSTSTALETEDRLRATLAEKRRVDAEAGRATLGPHRSDLVVQYWEKQRLAADCSTGEQKALLIGIVLANARLQARLRGTPPLLLLDEVVAHLDAGRRAALFEVLEALRAQAWMTGTDIALFSDLGDRAQVFHVQDGTVRAVP